MSSQNNRGRYSSTENLKKRIIYGPPSEFICSLNPNNLSPFTSLRVISNDEEIGLTFEDVNNTGNNFNWDTAGAQLSIQSTNANDNSTGTGVQSLLLQGLDTNWDIINETVLLDGTTSVLTTNTFLRLNGLIIVGIGSNGNAVGDVTVTGDSFTWGKVQAGSSLSNDLGRFSTARGHSLIFENFGWTAGQNGDFILSGFFKNSTYAAQESGRFYVHSNSEFIKGAPNVQQEKTDFWFMAKRESGGGGSQKLSVFFTGWLSNNVDLLNYY